MLVLSRKVGEKIHIGDAVVTLIKIDRDKIRLGIEAPKTTKIMREEIIERVQKEIPNNDGSTAPERKLESVGKG